jgi:hypothetical protein
MVAVTVCVPLATTVNLRTSVAQITDAQPEPGAVMPLHTPVPELYVPATAPGILVVGPIDSTNWRPGGTATETPTPLAVSGPKLRKWNTRSTVLPTFEVCAGLPGVSSRSAGSAVAAFGCRDAAGATVGFGAGAGDDVPLERAALGVVAGGNVVLGVVGVAGVVVADVVEGVDAGAEPVSRAVEGARVVAGAGS